ncbi:MAG: ribosome assembly cofactor RimP [Bacteroidales bacterium]|nr:ribosome assembly cofactor RimP [Bacteroidales bacterium]
MIDKNYIESLVKKKLVNSDKFIVDIKISATNKISVFLDSDTQLTIDDCVQVSRFIESNLDRDKEDFELQVSSPGITESFKLKRQYQKNIGREISVTLNDGLILKGVLLKVSDKSIILQKNIKNKSHIELKISFTDIKQAKPVISFKRQK